MDLGQLYDNATPNPTGSLSGPYFIESPGKTVIGVKGKTSHLACSIKNLGNLTVSLRQNKMINKLLPFFHDRCLGSDTMTPTLSQLGCIDIHQMIVFHPCTSQAQKTGFLRLETHKNTTKVYLKFSLKTIF